MTERPILFSAPMVRAILAGTKTQTRRVVKPQGPMQPECWDNCIVQHGPGHSGVGWYAWDDGCEDDGAHLMRCPYGQPGDRLWVREAFIHEPADYCWEASVSIPCRPASTVYRADQEGDTRGAGWKPSIHMPRSLSRITLEITGVRVERLQDISEADAQAEGAPGYEEGVDSPPPSDDCEWSYRASFERLWRGINGPDSWRANPWVWVVEFKRAEAS